MNEYTYECYRCVCVWVSFTFAFVRACVWACDYVCLLMHDKWMVKYTPHVTPLKQTHDKEKWTNTQHCECSLCVCVCVRSTLNWAEQSVFVFQTFRVVYYTLDTCIHLRLGFGGKTARVKWLHVCYYCLWCSSCVPNYMETCISNTVAATVAVAVFFSYSEGFSPFSQVASWHLETKTQQTYGCCNTIN